MLHRRRGVGFHVYEARLADMPMHCRRRMPHRRRGIGRVWRKADRGASAEPETTSKLSVRISEREASLGSGRLVPAGLMPARFVLIW
eukprot:scaffold105140_cov39-Tisochrysis_lutea.AAC.5